MFNFNMKIIYHTVLRGKTKQENNLTASHVLLSDLPQETDHGKVGNIFQVDMDPAF